MQENSISRTLFIVVLLVLLLNAILSTSNLVEDGALLRRVVPAASWSVAAILWIVSYTRKKRDNR